MKDIVKKLLSNKWLLALTAIGFLLLLFGASGGGTSTPSSPHATPVIVSATSVGGGATSEQSTASAALTSAIAYENYYDHTLTTLLDQIKGVSNALVMVTVNSTPVNEYGQNLVTTRQNTVQSGSGNHSTTTSQSTQSTLVTVQNSNGNQVPVVVAKQMPQIKGVLVIAKSSNAVWMQSEITNAVQDALGIPSYEITVLMRK